MASLGFDRVTRPAASQIARNTTPASTTADAATVCASVVDTPNKSASKSWATANAAAMSSAVAHDTNHNAGVGSTRDIGWRLCVHSKTAQPQRV